MYRRLVLTKPMDYPPLGPPDIPPLRFGDGAPNTRRIVTPYENLIV